MRDENVYEDATNREQGWRVTVKLWLNGFLQETAEDLTNRVTLVVSGLWTIVSKLSPRSCTLILTLKKKKNVNILQNRHSRMNFFLISECLCFV